MKTSLSVAAPTGLHPLVARLRPTLFCLAAAMLGTDGGGGGGCLCGGRGERPTDGDPTAGSSLRGRSGASFNRAAWGRSRPDGEVSGRGRVWVEVEVGTRERGQPDTGGDPGGAGGEGLWSA